MVEDLGGEVEVVCNDRLGGVGEPVSQDEGRLFREVARIEDEEELGSVLTKTLQGVRDAGGEVPEVAL
jgi:hypothetical protein